MAGEGFEPSKAEPTDLQSVPFDRSGTPPRAARSVARRLGGVPQTLGLGQRLGALPRVVGLRLELLQLLVLDLADALAGHVEGLADLLERARTLAREPVAHLDHL